MELKYPIVVVFTIVLIIVIFFLVKKKKIKYDSGSKIANTRFIKNNEYYKQKLFIYNLIKASVYFCCILSIIVSSILIARPVEIEAVDSKQYNRDIILCMDVSGSVNELNLDIAETLKDTVNHLHGERFGISIFNTTSVTLVPLTDDYGYVLDVLDQIKKSIETLKNYRSYSKYHNVSLDTYYDVSYLIEGTTEGSNVRGASLIGDGLASCVYNFSNLDKDRTRLIVLTTDNKVEGYPYVDLSIAADISKSKNIKVFGIGTKTISYSNKYSFKEAVNKTGGKYYETNFNTVNNIVKDIEKTSKKVLDKHVETRETDLPTVPFIVLVISSFSLIILSRKVIK